MANSIRIIDSIDPKNGGPSYSVRESSQLMNERGHQVTILTNDSPHSDFVKNSPIHMVAFDRKQSLSSRINFTRWIQNNAHKYDLCLIHGVWQWPTIAWLLAKPAIPFIVMPHGSLDVWDKEIRPTKMLAKKLYWYAIEKHLYDKADACYFTSTQEQTNSLKNFPLKDNQKTKIIPYGPNDSKIYRTQVDISDSTSIGYLGRIHPKKGIELLLESFSNAFHDNLNATLKIAGSGPADYISRLKDLTKKNRIESKVKWVGELSGKDKYNFLCNIGLFVLPSYQENFGIAVAEALSCGTPCLVSNHVNIHPQITKNKAGLVRNRTVDDFTQGLIHWKKSLDAEPNIRLHARTCYLSEFSLVEYVKHIEEHHLTK